MNLRIGNYSAGPVSGWFRTNTDWQHTAAGDAPPECGTVDGITYVLGRRTGRDTRILDVHCTLNPGQLRTIDLDKAEPAEFDMAPVPNDTGWPALAGVPMAPMGPDWIQRDGAHWLVHLHCRVDRMLHADLWVWMQPQQPWARGELVITASNPRVADAAAIVPPGLLLTCGDAQVLVPGLPHGAPLLPAGEVLGDGQAKAFPVTIVWPGRLRSVVEASTASAAANLEIGMVAIERLHPLGNPYLPERFDPIAWAKLHRPRSLGELHSWDAGPLGVAARSANSGDQECQGYCSGGEAMHPLGVGCEQVYYLDALGQARRPCHHLEADGSLLDLRRHRDLVFWAGRQHYDQRVSPDQLGKIRPPTEQECHGWSGPDDEHRLYHTVVAAARLTGSPALQWELQHAARVWMLDETVRPGWSTSGARRARARGWAGMLVAQLWDNLEDRDLAEQVAAHWRRREPIILAEVGSGEVWDTWDRPNVLGEVGGGATLVRPMYQEAVGVFGCWLAAKLLDQPALLAAAETGARSIVRDAYTQDAAGRFIEWDMVRWPNPNYVEGQGAHRTGWFSTTWFPLGVWVAARAGDEKAKGIWRQIEAEAMLGSAVPDWLPPLAWN